MRFIFCVVIAWIVWIASVEAGLYRCEKLDGSIEFRDSPCETSAEEQSYLPIPNKRSMSSMISRNGLSEKALLKEKKALLREEKKSKSAAKKLARQKEVQKRKDERSQKSLEKKQAKEALKLERRRLRCQKLDEKLRAIEDEFRTGCRIKRCQQLQKEKEHCLKMKHRYCSELPKSMNK